MEKKINRKAALKLLACLGAAIFGPRIEAHTHQETMVGSSNLSIAPDAANSPIVTTQAPVPSVMLDLGYFKGFVVRNGKDEVTISPKELWEALNDNGNHLA